MSKSRASQFMRIREKAKRRGNQSTFKITYMNLAVITKSIHNTKSNKSKRYI